MKNQNFYKLFFFVAALMIILISLLCIKNLLVSFVIASVIFFMLAPTRNYLERRGLSKLVSTIIPFLLLATTIVIGVELILPILSNQIENLRADFPKYLVSFKTSSQNFKIYLAKFFPLDLSNQIIAAIQENATNHAENIFKGIPDVISSSLTVMFLAPLLAFFMLFDGRQIIRSLMALVPNNIFELCLSLNHQITTQMGGFIRARFWETVIYTVFLWISLLIIGFPYSLVLAILGGVLNIIPYIGPVIGALPAFVIASSQGIDGDIAFKLVIIYCTAQIFDMVLIVPLLVAKIVNLHPVSVVLSVIVGSQVLGILGMIICLPVASTIKITMTAIYKHLTGHRNQ